MVVSGTVVGNIHASGQVVLHKTARVDGDISSPSLVVEEGATLNGTLHMGKAAQAAQQPQMKQGGESKPNQPGKQG